MAIMASIRQNTVMQDLIKQAKGAIQHCYAPYSQFRVAAAVLDEAGNVHIGVNVENVSFGMTQCAERNAICSAVTKGAKSITAVVIYTPAETPTPPCGACRQVIREFASHATVLSVCDSEKRIESTIDDLLPHSFNQEQHLS
ncbi:MAG: cytidine deaminase [Pseudohongiellaceae bacterium]|jgi:cytidine deaminase